MAHQAPINLSNSIFEPLPQLDQPHRRVFRQKPASDVIMLEADAPQEPA
jgi:hypothetical protein